MRLFTALWLPREAVVALAAEVASQPPPGWRGTDQESWHLTLAFHGEADVGVLARRLQQAARGIVPPRLRVSGAGAFPGVRWAGVEAEPLAALHRLVRAAGGDPAAHVAHVTVLRRRTRPGTAPDPDPDPAWMTHRGPWWVPAEVVLVVSEPARGGSRYRVVHRVVLAPASGAPR